MIQTQTLLTAVFVVLTCLLPAPSQIAQAKDVPCDNSKLADKSKSLIPMNKEGQPLMPEEIQVNPKIVEKLKKDSLTKEDIRRCLENNKPLNNHVIDFDQYVAAWMELKDPKPALLIENSVLWSFKDQKALVNLAKFTKKTKEADGTITNVLTGQIIWHNVTMGPSFSAKEIKFPKGTSFQASRFPDVAHFRSATFGDNTSFTKAAFGHSTRFSEATFGNGISFSRATFDGAASFNNVTFGDNTSFKHASFGNHASFVMATFDDNASFAATTFGHDTHFFRSIFGDKSFFAQATFGDSTSFKLATFGDGTHFKNTTFGNNTSFKHASFGNDTAFQEATFGNGTRFNNTTFGNDTAFQEATFGNGASFGFANFRDASFSRVTFGDDTHFSSTAFHDDATFFLVTFGDQTSFSGATFHENARFNGATFGDDTKFYRATFAGNAIFFRAIFGGEMSLWRTTFRGKLNLSNTTWEGQADLREAVVQNLCWISMEYPSKVKGVFDAREAKFMKAVFRDIHFSDLVDFSDVDFGRTENTLSDGNNSKKNSCGRKVRPSPKQSEQEPEKFLFQGLIFEKEVDFLRAAFHNNAIFIGNRFRSMWDLTGVKFQPREGQAERENPHLCLSFNRINKLFMERQQLGHVSSWTEYFFPDLLPLTALKKSRIRDVIGDGSFSCSDFSDTSPKENGNSNETEDLSEIYKTIELSFREANDRLAVNEAWYLGMLATHKSSNVKNWAFWVFGDFPSRYGIDLYRVVLVSVGFMLAFSIFYGCYFRRQIRIKKRKQYVKLKPRPDQKRAFRFRPFERFSQSEERQKRPLHPWQDALFLSGRAFFKLGLGTAYPRTRVLVWVVNVEWFLGMYMLIHFLLALKNTLPIAVPFLTVAG